MRVYAESSAVLAWLLGEPPRARVRRVLSKAEIVVASDLTLVECERALIRARTAGLLTDGVAADRQARLQAVAARWAVLRLGPDIIDRARRPFPGEPIRILDALHLASALSALANVPELALLSLDDRVRRCARTLGFEVLPADSRAA